MENNLVLKANDIISAKNIRALVVGLSDGCFKLLDIHRLEEVKILTDGPLFLDMNKNSNAVNKALYECLEEIEIIGNLGNLNMVKKEPINLLEWINEHKTEHHLDYFLNEEGEIIVVVVEPSSVYNEFYVSGFNLDKHCIQFTRDEEDYKDLKNHDYVKVDITMPN